MSKRRVRSVRQALALLEGHGARLVIGLQVLVETWVVATRPLDQNRWACRQTYMPKYCGKR